MIHRRIRFPLTLLTAALCTAGLAACGSSSSSSSSSSGSSSSSAAAAATPTTATTSTTINAASHTSGPTLKVGDQAGTGAEALLQAAGLLHSFSFPIEFADFSSGPPILQAIGAGALDIGNIGNAPPVFAAAGGAKLKIVGALKNEDKDVGLLVPKGSSITSVNQLKGKKIAVAEGSSADYHLLYVLHKAGLTPQDVQLVYLQPAEGLAAFESGAVDAWDIWPPFIEQVEIQKGARVLAGAEGEPGNYSYAVASDSSIADATKAKEIKQYLTKLNQAHKWANSHPAGWAKSWAAATGLPTSIMTKAAQDTIQTPVPVDQTVISAEQGLVSLFSGAGLIPKSYSFTPYASTAFNASVQ